ncbi:DUF4328 domain-containing protein [Streptomyces sp. A3M-1-3]|uniref:DUF4328 domain-containing protein n=1 Tax=Streptomyces sp. A3M-1-3 TaxID=2962044 RepID=UPI0020B6F1BC|nr:DUF4328 domain-containing protein [Streptomyces sp. A3M-1-3]MCP3820980.1 DUF4328 domain-containing protein [Streptomyces sp. A3M-1-3]
MSKATTGEGLCDGCVIAAAASAPPPPAVSAHPARLRSPVGLSYAVLALLGLVVAADLFAMFAAVSMHGAMGDAQQTQGSVDRANDLSFMAANLQRWALLATATLFIIWFHRVRANADVFAPDGHTRGRGWAIGAWFIPIANLWIPRGIAVGIWRASAPEGPHLALSKVSHAVVNAWWTIWVVAILTGRLATTRYNKAVEPEQVRDAAELLIAANLADIAAAALAMLFVRTLTSMQRIKAQRG